jgi:protein-tyrosine phosphatase
MSDPLVRPVSYVEDEPVVRRIGDRDLFLGNELAADPSLHDRSFDAVLSVSSTSHPGTTHHHPLDDGPDNTWPEFAGAIDTARRLHRTSGPLLVNCKAGVSRSTTIVATTLAVAEGRRFRDVLEEIQTVRPIATPHPALHELAVYYLAANGSV